MNILTIDMDFISDLYLGRMESFVGGPITEHFWSRMLEESGILRQDIRDNKHNVMYIFKVFVEAIKNNDNVVFGTYHDGILNHIDMHSMEELDIVNIDHHHDMGYCDLHRIENKYGECSEADWVPLVSHRVSSYRWVANSNSTFFIGPAPFNFYYSGREEAPSLEGRDWDLIYVCLSPNYTADEHWFYYFMLIELFKTLKGKEPTIDPTRYTAEIGAMI